MALLGVLRQVVARENTRRENIAREEGGWGRKGLSRTLSSHTVLTSMCDHLRQAGDHNLSKTPKFSRTKRSRKRRRPRLGWGFFRNIAKMSCWRTCHLTSFPGFCFFFFLIKTRFTITDRFRAGRLLGTTIKAWQIFPESFLYKYSKSGKSWPQGFLGEIEAPAWT